MFKVTKMDRWRNEEDSGSGVLRTKTVTDRQVTNFIRQTDDRQRSDKIFIAVSES